MALNPRQVIDHDLPTRPGKWSDRRQAGFAARFGGASVELDALPPDILTRLVGVCIASEIDRAAWAKVMDAEALEVATLGSLAAAGWVPGRRYAAPEDAA